MSLRDFVVSPPGCDRSVTDFWGWDAHEARLRCPGEVDGDIWIWSGWWYMDMKWMVIYGYEVPGGVLNLRSTKLPRPWSPWEYSPSRKNPHGWTGNRTRDLIISSQHYKDRAKLADHRTCTTAWSQRCWSFDRPVRTGDVIEIPSFVLSRPIENQDVCTCP
jgi:hypothetical protein